jgi:threonylcarbamoyladenosine tRNA methylthiotransferase MtaB
VKRKTVGIHTLGCKLNFSESATIIQQFNKHGFECVDFESPADVYIINTCSVTENADRRCRKAVETALKQNPEAAIIVVGCYAQLKPAEIAEIPGVTAVLGAAEKFRIFELLPDLIRKPTAQIFRQEIGQTHTFVATFSSEERTRAFLKVQDGCNYKCSFCTIPLARGISRSDSLPNIANQLSKFKAEGIQEVVISGINLGDYFSPEGEDFVALVKMIAQTAATPARIRFSSIEPNLLSNAIIELFANHQKLMPHFHIPLQSGSDKILAAMRRRYKTDLYADRVAYIRKCIPDAAIGCDVITGFPGETAADFEETYQFLADLEVSYLHVFSYSERANTLAANLPNKIPDKVKQERSRRLRELSYRKARVFHQRFVGTYRPVLVERSVDEQNYLSGFTDNYLRVRIPYHPGLVNTILPVYITAPDDDSNFHGLCVATCTEPAMKAT